METYTKINGEVFKTDKIDLDLKIQAVKDTVEQCQRALDDAKAELDYLRTLK